MSSKFISRSAFISMLFFSVPMATASPLNITVVGDPIGGGNLASDVFTIATAGTFAGVNNYPPGQSPSNVLDHNSGTKYLNFRILDSGFIVSPVFGDSDVTGISFTTGIDAPERDPASYQLYGSNSVSALSTPGTTYSLSHFTLISSGTLSLPTDRLDSSAAISFANTSSYTTYLLVFPTVRGPSANSMQIADVTLTGTAPVPEPTSLILAALGLAGSFAFRRWRVRSLR